MLAGGDVLSLTIEKPAAGGRMIARADGQVVLVAGALPGERVSARIERVSRGVAFAQAIHIEESSPDRREPFTDPLCGGCLYAYVKYPRQLRLKAEIIADTFARIGHFTLPAPVPVAASPEDGYRMRARVHVKGPRLGFFREGTYELCDARATRQLLPATCDVLQRLADGLSALGSGAVRELEIAENTDASRRAVHLHGDAPSNRKTLAGLAATEGLTGLSIGRLPGALVIAAGEPFVSDTLSLGDRSLVLRRHVLAFFQGNRYLLRSLVAHVIDHVPDGSTVIDLYSGAGLFSIAAAAVRGARVTAVEGDRLAAADLLSNARAASVDVKPVHQPVETFLKAGGNQSDVLIVDPPRTGMSADALRGAVALHARTIVYVSCDIATLARDAGRIRDGGYQIQEVAAFDMFPNTPHVETVAVFERERAR
jgi:23S rRNA (uracil1939-C5)-methyltransferase